MCFSNCVMSVMMGTLASFLALGHPSISRAKQCHICATMEMLSPMQHMSPPENIILGFCVQERKIENMGYTRNLPVCIQLEVFAL